MRSQDIPRRLNEQNGLFTLIVRSDDQSAARVIGSIDRALSGTENAEEILALLGSPTVRIVSSTVTEKGYGIDARSGKVDLSNSVIVNDLDKRAQPQGFIGYLVRALNTRRLQGMPAFTVLSCDNLPDNGRIVRSGVLDFAQRYDADCADWIAENVAFPCTMVDRITPASTTDTFKSAIELTGTEDLAAVECEPFHQWVIEDNFPLGKPDWAAAGVLLTSDVQPFEQMKLRMLNGTHSLMAYSGFLSGCTFVRDVMADANLQALVERHLKSAISTLGNGPDINLAAYAEQLQQRFRNTAIAHETYQIAMDGSQKMPQRIFLPALDAVNKGQSVRPFAFATAMWIRFCAGKTDAGDTYSIRDPLAETLKKAAAQTSDPSKTVRRFSDIAGLIPASLADNPAWNSQLEKFVAKIWIDGVYNCVIHEARGALTDCQ